MKRSGFTVIELLIVVAIVALLSSIAIPSYIHYSNSAKVSEAISRLGSIKMRQEAYFSEYHQYASASPNPTEIPIEPTIWEPTREWLWLGFNPGFYTRFQYTVQAGFPGILPYHGSMGWIRRSDRGREKGHRPSSGDLGFSGTDYWFVAQARGDLDDDGDILLVEMYSASRNIYISSPKGWE